MTPDCFALTEPADDRTIRSQSDLDMGDNAPCPENGKTKRLFPKGKSLFALKLPSFHAKWGRDAFVWFCIRHPTRISEESHFAGSFQGGGRILSVILPHGRILSAISYFTTGEHFRDASGSVQESFSGSFFFLPSDSFSTSASVRYSTAGSTSVIITTEQTVPIPSNSPTVEMEF